MKSIKTMKNQVTIGLDCERNGLRGQFISVAAVYYVGKNKYQQTWAVNPKNISDLNEWVHDNVLPFHPQVTHETTVEMLIAFAEWWKQLKSQYEITIVGHMICPVETDLFSELYKLGLIGEFQGPYRFFDINVLLDIVTGKHDALNLYLKKKGHKLESHDPAQDAEAALLGYHLLKEEINASKN